MTRIKLSGVTDPGDAATAAELGVDIVGCVFYAKSPRYVTMAQALEIRRVLPAHVHLAGIFVDTPSPVVQNIAAHVRLDMVQLFGSEPRSALETLGAGAFKAVTVRQPAQIDAALNDYLGRWGRPASEPALMLHLVGDLATGWSHVAAGAARAALVLAAEGLDAATVASAINTARPWSVDVWSVVEREPGRLDGDRLAEFVLAARAADREAAIPSADLPANE